MKITDELLYAHAAAGQALWLSTLPDPAELDPFVPSRWFQRKMKKLLRQCRRTPRVNTAIRYTKRVALTALVSAVVIFSSLMTVASFRAKVVEVITEVFDTLTSYIFRPGEAESAPLSEVEFGWLPDNLQDVFTDETDEFRHLRFEFSDGKFISYSQLCLSDNTKTIGIEDSEYANFSTIELNGQIAKVTEKDGEYTLIWTSENKPAKFGDGRLPAGLYQVLGRAVRHRWSAARCGLLPGQRIPDQAASIHPEYQT